MKAPDPELQAIFGICHHATPHENCLDCTFRQQVIVEHLSGLCLAMIEKLERNP